MNRTTMAAAALALSVVPALGLARPYPAGRCSTLDDGVDEALRAGQPRRPDIGPRSMDLPTEPPASMGRLDNAFVADVAFTIEPDGSVSSPRLLCARPADRKYTGALLRLMPRWSFQLPAETQGASVEGAYRIVVVRHPARSETIPLGWRRIP